MEQGQSSATAWKRDGFASAFRVNLSVVKKSRKLDSLTYMHFDLNAGSGWNDRVQVLGSPLAFLEDAAAVGYQNYRAHFVERDEKAAHELFSRLSGYWGVSVHNEDNSEFITKIPAILHHAGHQPRWCLGSVVVDPNGPTQAPWREIGELLATWQMLDVFVNWSGTAMKRIPDGHESRVDIRDLPDLFHKRHWLVRIPKGAWQWSLLIGRNFPVGDHRKAGFVDWESPEGREYIDTLALTAAERDERDFHDERQGTLL